MSPPSVSRRDFLAATAAAGAAGSLLPGLSRAVPARAAGVVVIGSTNGAKALGGTSAVAKAYSIAAAGGDPLEAAVEGVVLIELDPTDHSVGLGGLPNEEGVVELDASVMHGPRCTAGAVASLRNLATPSRVARKVMERSDHVLLVGEGALRFARAHGFEERELLTPEAREIWLHWKETLSKSDDWLEKEPCDAPAQVHEESPHRSPGTIHLSVRTAAGDLAGCTSTSGLAFKIPGRVGDSPILGCGLYVDNEVGSAGSTGRGEAVILSGGSRTVIEAMRSGKGPREACLAALERVARMTRASGRRDLLDAEGRPFFDLLFYAVNKAGEHGAGAMWGAKKYAVCDEKGARLEDAAPLFEGRPKKR
ncbi:MAG: N(4)-(beta-N-acetylglucosaminyl)-L-asparaginase [Planctomycetes bacterium]|nr:N(4)-(beta-N-acetylglucosaminyl)-L-asparaginase [Planctomycetota bacterium]